MTEPADEQQPPSQVPRPRGVMAGWLQDDSQLPWELLDQRDPPPELHKLINDNFWELLSEPSSLAEPAPDKNKTST